MKSMWPPSTAIFFMAYFRHGPLGPPPGSATDVSNFVLLYNVFRVSCVDNLYYVVSKVKNSKSQKSRKGIAKKKKQTL